MAWATYSVYIEGQPFTERDGIRYTKQNVVAFHDRVRVVGYQDGFFGGDESRAYRSPIMVNPTWKKLLGCLSSQMKKTRDYHHCFLEGARIVRREVDSDGVSYAIVELLTGS
jgi:hypothetical protein